MNACKTLVLTSKHKYTIGLESDVSSIVSSYLFATLQWVPSFVACVSWRIDLCLCVVCISAICVI